MESNNILIDELKKLGCEIIHQSDIAVGFSHSGELTLSIKELAAKHRFLSSHSGLDNIHTTTILFRKKS